MKPRARWLMLTLSLAVLAGAWLLAEYMAGGAAEEAVEVSAVPELVDLSVGSYRDMTAISWVYDGQTVNLARDAETGRWVNADDGTCPVDDAAAQALARAASGAAADMVISDVTEFSQYGLDAPAITIIAATEDAIASYELGNMSITGEYYLRMNGENTVYLETGTLAPAFRVHLAELLALERVPSDIAEVTGLSVWTEAGGYELQYAEETAQWFRTDEETGLPLEEERVRALYEPLVRLPLTRCVTWNAVEPEQYGLSSPQGTAAVRYLDAAGREKSFMLEFGAYAGSDVYVSFAGSDMVYLVEGATLDTLMYPAWDEMLPLTVLAVEPERVRTVSLELGGHSYEIVRLRETTEIAVSGGESAVEVTDVIYSSGGWVLDTAQMDGWLGELSALTADGLAPAGDGREQVLSVGIEWDGEEETPAALDIRNYDSAHYLCVADGERRLLVPRAAVDKLIADAEAILLME